MSSGPNYFDPKEIFGDDYEPNEEDQEAGGIEIVPSEDGEGFNISGSVEDILEMFTSGIVDIVEQGVDDGVFDESQVGTVIKAIAQIREALELDE